VTPHWDEKRNGENKGGQKEGLEREGGKAQMLGRGVDKWEEGVPEENVAQVRGHKTGKHGGRGEVGGASQKAQKKQVKRGRK